MTKLMKRAEKINLDSGKKAAGRTLKWIGYGLKDE